MARDPPGGPSRCPAATLLVHANRKRKHCGHRGASRVPVSHRVAPRPQDQSPSTLLLRALENLTRSPVGTLPGPKSSDSLHSRSSSPSLVSLGNATGVDRWPLIFLNHTPVIQKEARQSEAFHELVSMTERAFSLGLIRKSRERWSPPLTDSDSITTQDSVVFPDLAKCLECRITSPRRITGM